MDFCDDIIGYMLPYVNETWLKLTNKSYYKKFINTYTISDTVIRRLIRKDSYYIFKLILDVKIYSYVKRKRYVYGINVYKNYVEFMIYYTIKNEATQCLNTIKHYDRYLIKNK